MSEYQDVLMGQLDFAGLHAILKAQGKESFEGDLANWFAALQQSAGNAITRTASRILAVAYLKGASRAMDRKGNRIMIGNVPDTSAIMQLASQQSQYFQNMSDEMKQLIFTELEQGINQGKPYAQITQDILDKSKELAKTRVQRIVRTELVKAHNAGVEQTFGKAGITKYIWVTQRDLLVCEVCKKYETESRTNGGFDLGNPDSPRPVKDSHPNCRCVLVAA